jgi:DNA mismatch endonuclease (patch repair protein)
MSRIRSRDTKPELIVRKMLHGMGYGYRLHVRDLPGTPDIVFRGRKKVIFVHGCFWHGHEGCRFAAKPSTRDQFWRHKIEAAQRRDALACEALTRDGWKTLIVWECELSQDALRVRLISFLGTSSREAERSLQSDAYERL